MKEPLLRVSGLTVKSHNNKKTKTILKDISLTIKDGEMLGLIGETGSGKSMLGWALVDLLPRSCYRSDGIITYGNVPISDIPKLRGGKVAMVFQDPMQSLNPIQTIGSQIKTLFDNNVLMCGDEELREERIMKPCVLRDDEDDEEEEMLPYPLHESVS